MRCLLSGPRYCCLVSGIVCVLLSGCLEITRVPHVVGEHEESAAIVFRQMNLVMAAATYRYSNTVPEGYIISQQPEGGEIVLAGMPVYLVVSVGPNASIAVPDLIGKNQFTAEELLAAAGLVPGTICYEFSDTVLGGAVCSQDPAAGSIQAWGTSVDFCLSLGPAQP